MRNEISLGPGAAVAGLNAAWVAISEGLGCVYVRTSDEPLNSSFCIDRRAVGCIYFMIGILIC
jgi:hypothetical protein